MKGKIKKYRFIIALILIILFGTFLRSINIDWGLDKQQPWITEYEDEPYSYDSAFNIKPFEGKLDPGKWAIQKGTFYFTFIGFVNNIFEITGIKDLVISKNYHEGDEFYLNMILGRSINILFSIGSIILIYALSIILFKRKIIGILAAFNYSIFAHEIAFSNVLVGDTMITFFSTATIYFSILSVSKNNEGKLFYAALFSGLTMATKYNGIITLLPVTLSLILNLKKKELKEKIKTTLSIVVIFISAFMVGMPSIIFNYGDFLNGVKSQIAYQSGDFLPGVGQFPRFFYYFTNVFHYGLGLIFTILIAIGTVFYVIKKGKQKETWLILSFLAPYYAIISTTSWITQRITMPLMPIFAIIVAYLIFEFYAYLENKKIAVSLIVILYIYNLTFLYNFIETISEPEARKQFFDYEKQYLNLNKEKPEITFMVWRLENVSHPTMIDYPAQILFMKDISGDSRLMPTTKYVLVADNQIRDILRLRDRRFIRFFEDFNRNYKLVHTFKKNYALPFFYYENTYFSSDLELFMKKFYLYELSTSDNKQT